MAAIVDLDHVGIAVRNLDAAAAAYRRLGFRLTEKSEHVAAGPDGALIPAGTGNRCFILERGYVELIAVTRLGYSGRLLKDLAHHEGLHLVSVGAPSAQAAESLFRRTTGGPAATRRVKRPFRESGRDFVAEFAIVDPPEGSVSGLHLFAIEHLTREAIWQPQLMDHPNGAVALVSVTLCATDADALRSRLSRILDAPTDADAIVLTRGKVDVASPDVLTRRFPGVRLPAPPCAAAMTIAVRDLEQTRVWLNRQDVENTREPDRIVIAPALACGAIVEFVADVTL